MEKKKARWQRTLLLLAAASILAGPAVHAVDLSVASVELTQAIQDSSGSNALIAGNHTAARVYVQVSNSATPVGGVTAFLSVFKNGSLHTLMGPNAPGFITAPLVPDPDNQGHSLNFTLPLDLSEDDTVDLVIDLDPMDQIAEDDETNNSTQVSGVVFECRETPEIVYSTVNYTAPSETDPSTIGTPDPDLIAAGTGDDFVFGIFPFPDDRSQYHSGPFPPINWDENIDSSFTDFLNFLEDCRQAINPVPKYLYAWFRENPYNGNGRAISIPGHVAFGNTQTSPDRYQRTFAHEMGHLFGLVHNSRDLAPDTGWDVENLLGLGNVMPSTKWDIMRGGQLTPSAWIDDVTYDTLLGNDCFQCEGDTGPPYTVAPYITLQIRRTPGGGTLDPGFEWPRNVWPTRGVPGAPVVVRARGIGGQVLEEIGLVPNFESESGEKVEAASAAVTFSTTGIQSIELVEGELVSSRIDRSPNPPQVTVLSPRTGETLGKAFQVSWQGYDPDGGPLTYIVQYSWGYDRQGRQLWVPLAVGVTGNQITVDSSYLAGSSNGSIRVLASDGLNTGSAEVGGLYLSNESPPKVAIGNSGVRKPYLEGSLVILQASVHDREDVDLPPESVRWTSDLDGPLATGPTLQTATLSPGTHRITVTAVDSAGAVSRDQVELTVLPSLLGRALEAARAAKEPAVR